MTIDFDSIGVAFQTTLSRVGSGMEQPSWIKPEKLRPQVPVHRLLSRDQILAQLQKNERPLVFVQAAAGYGKTSLLAQWHTSLRSRAGITAWVSLDEDDADPSTFLCNLIAALKEAGCNVEYELPHHPKALSKLKSDDVFNAMMNKLSRKTLPQFIFFDDFHLVMTDEICRFLRRLLETLPKTTLVIASRSIPPGLGLAELRSQGRCFELSQRDLRFERQEVEHYFRGDVGSESASAHADELLERTEGWPIGLFATRTLVREGIALEDALAQASGRSGILSDYFMERVFALLTDDEKNLLLRTASLNRVNGDLADSVCGASTGWKLLEKLERHELFVTCLVEDRSWYRYHRLFAEFLTERARRQPAFDQKEIHTRASRWALENGYDDDALDYALRSGNPDLIAATLEAIGGWRQAVTGDMSSVIRALQALDPSRLLDYPRVWLADIYLKLKDGQWSDARYSYHALKKAFKPSAQTDAGFRSELIIFDGLITVYFDLKGQVRSAIDQLEELELTSRRDDHFLQSTRLNLLSGLHNRTYQFQNALREGDASIRHFRALNALYGEVFLYMHQCFALYETGRLRDAKATLMQGLALIEEHYGTGAELYALGAAYAAAFEYESNDFVQAQAYLAQAFPVIEHCDAWIEVYFVAYETDLKIAAAHGDWQRVRAAADRALKVAKIRHLPRLAGFIDATVIELKLKYSKPADSSEPAAFTPLFREHDFELSDLPGVSAQGRLLLESKRFSEAAEHFQNWAQLFKGKDLIRGFIKLKLLEAIAWQHQEQVSRSIAAFETVLSFARFEGFKRIIIDEGNAAATLIKEVSLTSRELGAKRLRDRFLAELVSDIEVRGTASNRTDSLLSPREADVMRLVLSGRTNREIATALNVSQNTVKFHLKNVFQKLAVSTRAEAINACLRDDVI